MSQEDKELLLKDLCARLPYGVMCQVDDGAAGLNDGKLVEIDISKELVRFDADYYWDAYIDDVRPYLRPMSSMTEEEILELYKITYDTWYSDSLYYKNEEWINFRDSIKNNNLCFKTCIWLSDINKVIDWLLKNHFDYHNLIERGLAIEVTKENNPYEMQRNL